MIETISLILFILAILFVALMAPKPSDKGPELSGKNPKPSDKGPELSGKKPKPSDKGPEPAGQEKKDPDSSGE